MIILPAIDIKNGQCVRLTKGDFNTVEKVAEDPLMTARSFEECGAEWIHMVDLDGAVAGKPLNRDIFLDVVKNTGLKVEVGGGIRTTEDMASYVEGGVERIILGSVAIQNPELAKEAVKEFGSKIAIGIDAKGGMASGGGWLEDSRIHYIELAKMMEQIGVKTIIYTDIAKDGTLSGPNLEHLEALQKAVSCHIIASGGIHVIEDIQNLAKRNLYGAICGKSIYKGTLSLREALSLQY